MNGATLSDDVAALARVAGLPVDGSYLAALAPFVGAMHAMVRSLGIEDIDGVVPSPVFDARWEA